MLYAAASPPEALPAAGARPKHAAAARPGHNMKGRARKRSFGCEAEQRRQYLPQWGVPVQCCYRFLVHLAAFFVKGSLSLLAVLVRSFAMRAP
jgi:hypothetical protein